jgi:hypothetical protein
MQFMPGICQTLTVLPGDASKTFRALTPTPTVDAHCVGYTLTCCLCACGAWVGHHGVHHTCDEHRLAQQVAVGDELLLHQGHLLRGNVKPDVAPAPAHQQATRVLTLATVQYPAFLVHQSVTLA